MTELEKWENSAQLSYAIVKFGDSIQLSKFREADSEGAIQAYKILMYGDLFAKVESREFEAFGFQIKPNAIPGPIKIPDHVFEPRPDLALAERDIVAASGYEYERVRVRPVNDSQSKVAVPMPSDSTKAGRPSTYAKTRTVLQTLFLTESNRDKSAAKLHPEFKRAFEKRFPKAEWQIATPSQRTLQDHLNRYRQELEENGNNNSAN